jgi:hypothetical protein
MEHVMGSAPPNIAVKRYFEWVSDTTFKLKLLKHFGMLPDDWICCM